MVTGEAIDVVLRFGHQGRIQELNRCLFALATQDYQATRVHLLCPGRSRADRRDLTDAIAPTLSLNPCLELAICDGPELGPAITTTSGRYLTFLDENDVVQPWGLRSLVSELQESDSSLAFGTVMDKFEQRSPYANITVGQRLCRAPERISQLFGTPYWWTGAALLDRARITAADLLLASAESAHDLILRLGAKYPSSFGQRTTIVADHYSAEPSRTNDALPALTRSAIVIVSEDVQRSLGLDPAPARRLEDVAEAFDPFG